MVEVADGKVLSYIQRVGAEEVVVASIGVAGFVEQLQQRKTRQQCSNATPLSRGAFDSAKIHKRQRRKRQSVTAKREKSQTPKIV